MAEEGVEKPRPRRSRAKMKKSDESLLPDEGPPSNSQLKLDQMLQKVVAESTKDAVETKKKKKKKPKNQDEEIMLESLRKGEGLEGLHKEKDSAIIANTYDSDNNIKSEKSNKQRQKRRDKNKSNIKSDDETKDKQENEAIEQITEKRKKKKAKSTDQLKVDESQDASEVPTEESKETVPKPDAKPRKKKVKSPIREKSEETQSPKDEEETDKKQAEEEVASTSTAKKKKKKSKDKEVDEEDKEEKEEKEEKPTEEEETEEKKPEKKKKKKKSKAKEPDIEAEEAETSEAIKNIQDHGEVMAIMIHRTDKLKTDFRILHPVVRVHVVNEETGEYLEKQHIDRAVTSYYETSNESVKTILPMMTQPFDFKQRRSTIPVWEDLLIFNENFNYITQPKPKVILFFELLDLVSMNTANKQFSSQKEEGGWHRIAWAFLKVLGANEKINTGNKLRLQLFSPHNKGKKIPGQPEVFQWWLSGQRTAYPSTLYVTLKSINSPPEPPGAERSMFATQKEMTSLTYKDLKSMNWSNRERTQDGTRTMTTWTRLFGQLCRIPNSLSLTLTSGRKGCYVVKFSHDGRNLACACEDGRDYSILVYEIPSGSLKGKFSGHFGIVYSLSWSKHDTQIMSASSDGTVRVWNIQNFGEPQDRLLPHPGFVYAAEFHPRVDSIVVTGGYDEVIRVWDISISEDGGMLQQEMEEHHGHVNSICFDTDDGQKMYSADSVGTILIWNVYVTEQVSRKHFVRDWTKFQALKDAELKDTSISYIQMHPSGRRLLVHARNNAIFMFDLRVQRVMQKYFGAENLKEKIHSTITPCGSFVISGSEDGKVYAWNTDTGDQVAVYTQLNYQNPVTDVHYHPRDHMLAMCSLGENLPVYLYKYDPAVAQAEALSPRPMSPVETTDVEDLEASKTGILKESDLMTARSKVMSKEEFQTQQLSRYQQIIKKMDNATMHMSQMPGMVVPENLLSSRMDMVGRSGIQSTWKMQFDSAYSLTPRSSTQPPGFLSPHAPSGAGTQLASQISSQRGYMKAGDGDWRPTFSELGRQGGRSPNASYFGRPPNLTLSTSLGKPQFTFESPVGKSATRFTVIALYDYRAQRSDELTLYRGDVVQVLYKDNENWWMGELENGKQGFFPANYVTNDDDPSTKKLKTPSVSSSETLTAVKTKSGELTFISGGEQSDDEKPRKGKKGRKGSQGSITLNSGSTKPSRERRSSIDDLLDQYESVA